MRIQDIASQFSILILSNDVDQGAALKVALAQIGYEVFFISDMEGGLKNIQQSLPHVVIVDLKSLTERFNDFVQKVLNISSEIRLIPLGAEDEYEVLSQYGDYGVSAILPGKTSFLEKKVIWEVNKICEFLYLSYQNEDLLKKNQAFELENNQLKEEATLKTRQLGAFRGLEALIQSYKTCENKEQVLNLFFDQMQGIKTLYFKYLPTVRSLMVTHSAGYALESIQGVGCQLPNNEDQDLASQVSLGVCPGTLALLLKRALGLSQFQIFPVFVYNFLEGLIVADLEQKSEAQLHFSEQFSLFSLAYSHFALEKKIETVDMQDAVTEVFNLKYYQKRLDEEVNRARRLKHPLALVKIAVDDIEEITQTLGGQVRDHVLKMVAQLMVKSSRSHDFVARVKDNELALVLVNCSRRGASVRADRLRRSVESSSVLDHGIKLSVSIGISEYPTLCDSAADLDETSSQSLMHIYDKGGNRLCLYKPTSTFKPEFEFTDPSGDSNVP